MKDKIVAFVKSVWEKVKAAYAKVVGVVKSRFARNTAGDTPVSVAVQPVDVKPATVAKPDFGPVVPIPLPVSPTPLTQETYAKLTQLSGMVSQSDPRYDPTFDIWAPGGGVANKSEQEAQAYIARFPDYV